jgi:capsular polysaccharide transport system permease protein
MSDTLYRVIKRPTSEPPVLEAVAWSRFRHFLAAARAAIGELRVQFLIIVAIPTLLSSIYWGLIASKRYVSHTEYIVRGVDSHKAVGIGALLTTIGISRAADDTSVIESFLKSREAIRQLGEHVNLREIYGRPEADFLSRFPWPWESKTFERLYSRMQNYISVIVDTTTGVTTLEVSAFRPEDAHEIAVTLLSLAEGVANRMNDRAEADSVKEAEVEVERARKAVLDAQASLTSFRNSENLIDPVSYAGVLLHGISELSLDRVKTQAQIKETSDLSPTSPSIPSLKAQVEALDHKIADEREKLAGGNTALAEKVSAYDQLTLTRDLADKTYANALTALLDARREAQRQAIYIEEMVLPNLPDEDTEPERMKLILTVFVLSFAVFSMVWVLTVGAKDHAQ